MKSTFYILFLFFLASNVCSQERLSGAQSDTLDPGEYIVEGDIWVESGILWYLRPGITLRFYDEVSFDIHGAFYAMGEEDDSIRFEAYDDQSAWSGLDFQETHYTSYLNYCVIIGSNEEGVFIDFGGSAHLSHSRISNNSNRNGDVAGMRSRYGGLCSLTFTTISDNDGVGYFHEYGGASFDHCLIKGNNSGIIGGECATFFINNTVISENMNSGLQIRNTAEAHVDSCKFVNNQAENGGGIVSNGAWIEISRTLFFGNYARNSGGAFFSEGEYLSNNLNNCVFTENQADSNGASIFTFSGFIVNSIFTGNGPSVNTFVSGDDFISYNSLYYGNESDIHFAEPDWVSEEFGIINTDNVNGDSCDQFYNLFMDPQFINPLDLNFHLRENSPCIDAGTSGIGWVDSLFDPDGGTTDIGIHYYHVSEVFEQKRNRSIPSQFSVKDIYPNPFNSSITIRFGLQVDSEINLSVFNIIGQKVAQLYSGKHTAGYHTVVFNGDNLSSGIYFIHAKVPGKMDKVRKIVLVR